ncbi:MAG: tRNA (N6-threonylcarbamoyladenosine(37)-N6)-methyltransferase TrmO [Gammaproteobacteria bacterium]|nr:tRNA (N6-threonylcarbamoyladenosine(37)-N6)-methyltransferase TrmO [Gammaproteobacteria bacterium]
MDYCFQPIGVIHSCYKDKFGVPRQPGLVSAARGELELFPPYDREEAWVGLEGFSHVWIQFVFHHCLGQEQRLSVRPPRLGGNRKLGVFATRSTHRPNPLGLSVVELAGMEKRNGRMVMLLRGLDLVEGTPVLDVKPYLPYVDMVSAARSGFAEAAPSVPLRVEFSPEAETRCQQWQQRWPELRELIVGVLALDPRPAYQERDDGRRRYGVRLHDLDVQWRVEGEAVRVEALVPVTPNID